MNFYRNAGCDKYHSMKPRVSVLCKAWTSLKICKFTQKYTTLGQSMQIYNNYSQDLLYCKLDPAHSTINILTL